MEDSDAAGPLDERVTLDRTVALLRHEVRELEDVVLVRGQEPPGADADRLGLGLCGCGGENEEGRQAKVSIELG